MTGEPASDAGLRRLNRLPASEAEAALLECCGARAWARVVAAARPFADRAALLDTADRVWAGLEPADWLEAFRAHPRIGERKAGGGADTGAAAPDAAPARQDRGASGPEREQAGAPRSGAWSEQEQAGALGADTPVLDELAALNREYETRFGHIFLICATGRSAQQMLDNLRARLSNPPDAELRVAAEEQRRITRLRLDKLLDAWPAEPEQPQ